MLAELVGVVIGVDTHCQTHTAAVVDARAGGVLARYARNKHLADATHQWAFCALTASPGARGYYDILRTRGTGHHAALRQLANRLVGILHGCLKTRTPYREDTAWPQVIADAA